MTGVELVRTGFWTRDHETKKKGFGGAVFQALTPAVTYAVARLRGFLKGTRLTLTAKVKI